MPTTAAAVTVMRAAHTRANAGAGRGRADPRPRGHGAAAGAQGTVHVAAPERGATASRTPPAPRVHAPAQQQGCARRHRAPHGAAASARHRSAPRPRFPSCTAVNVPARRFRSTVLARHLQGRREFLRGQQVPVRPGRRCGTIAASADGRRAVAGPRPRSSWSSWRSSWSRRSRSRTSARRARAGHGSWAPPLGAPLRPFGGEPLHVAATEDPEAARRALTREHAAIGEIADAALARARECGRRR